MRLFYVILLQITMLSGAYATHLMGGEVTAKQLHDSTYRITLTVYRDTLGIPMDSIANFEMRDTSGSVVMTFQIPYDTAISGNTLRLYPYGVEVYIFRDTIHLPGPGKYHISFLDCCRNGAIQNLSSPLRENMYLTTTVSYFGNGTNRNSTPFFLVQPVVFLPRNTSWAYNPLPFDPDGDSLVWSLDTPLTRFNTNCAGYTAPPSTSTGTFSINAQTGSISWTASTLGNFDATVLVEEYRNNVKIGEIRRDMQFIVVNPTSNSAQMTNMNELPTDADGNYHVNLNANKRYMFSFFADDPDSGDVVSILAFGEPFMYSEKARANFFVAKTGKTYGNEVEGTLIWKPTTALVRNKPYIIVYRVSDGIYTIDYTVLYTVDGEIPGPDPGTGIFEMEEGRNLRLYPNPVEDVLYIEFDSNIDYQNLNVEIYDMYGKLHISEQNASMENSRVTLNNMDLPEGSYILVVKSSNELLEHGKFIVSH